ncbi:MAG: T9SS type A sorting domain-containing protein [Chitinophagaceae bacterium]|nr:T9SS type A sorting domain-containing protein [Chitinophagaceae bacterium]
MTRTCTLTFITTFILTSFAYSQTTYVNNGTATNYNLGNGDSLYIQSGTYTGNITSFHKNAKITVAAGATFQPGNFNNPKGTLTVLGTAKFSTLNTNNDFGLENYGITEISGTTEMNGGSQHWNNYYGATLKFTGNVTMNSGADLDNDGTITAASTFTMNNGSEMTNNNSITITGAFVSNGGEFINLGKLETGGITFNSGTSFTNNCRLVINGNITNNNVTITNDGLIWIPAQYASATITNSGTINNTANGKIKARNFTNYGVLTGKGHYYFTGTTYNSGTVGVSGTTADTIKIYDATRTSPSRIFDTQWGTVRPNAIFATFAAPDTVNAYPSCGLRYASGFTVLPVKWNFFYVNLSNNTPALTWSSEQYPGTNFEIQRSYDGTNFRVISSVASVTGKTNYQFEDKQVNTQSSVVYYRINAIEPNGAQKISETKVVRFSNKQGVSIQTAPNPFTSQFSINYQSAEKGNLVIKVYSMTSQLQATKTVTVSKGFNSIAVTEAASLAKGFYMVQLTSNNTLLASEKVVKQ